MRLAEGLVDLDALVLACRDVRARELLAEAVGAYRAGSYRAAIVTTWIGVLFDFIFKLRELSAEDDADAKKLVEEFDLARTNNDKDAAMKLERGVLDHCESTFEFVSKQERIDLQRLLDDRNRCAHPAWRGEDERFDPPAELARTHMRAAVDILLSRRARSRRPRGVGHHRESSRQSLPSSDRARAPPETMTMYEVLGRRLSKTV